MERMVCVLGEFNPDDDGLLSRKMANVWEIWFYKNLRKKGVESTWRFGESRV